MPIDPCREWLGIDATALSDPLQVLGLAPGESDPLVIVRAADAQLARLRSVAPGPFERAHASILARVSEARDELLARAASSTAPSPPPPPPGGGFAPPPPPRGFAAARPAFTPSPAPPAPVAPPPVPPPVPAASAAAWDAADEQGESSVAITRSGARPRRSSGSGPVFAVLSLLVAAGAGIAAYVAWPRPGNHHHRTHVAHAAPHGGPGAQGTHPAKKSGDGNHAAAGKVGDDQAARERQAAERREAARLEAERRAEEARKQREEEQRRHEEHQRAMRMEAERKKAEQQKQAEQEALARAEAQRAAEARRMEEEAARAEADRARNTAAVERDLRDAYAALRKRDYAAAAQTVGEAEKRAGDDGDLMTRCGRWRLLVDYAAQLAGFEQQALASANEGREYQIGDRLIAIVEINPKTYAYKERGQMKRGARSDMPKAIERAILRQWFAGANNPANHIYLGIHRLLDDPPALGEVRREWETALAGEPATRSIMPLLDDPILTAGGQ